MLLRLQAAYTGPSTQLAEEAVLPERPDDAPAIGSLVRTTPAPGRINVAVHASDLRSCL